MDELELQKEETFFEGYKRAVALCLDYMRKTYDTWRSDRFPTMGKTVRFMDFTRPKNEERLCAFIQQTDMSWTGQQERQNGVQYVPLQQIGDCTQSSCKAFPQIIAAIKDKLLEVERKAAKEREEYIKGLLTPFSELSEAFFPYNSIKELQKPTMETALFGMRDGIDRTISLSKEYRSVLNDCHKTEGVEPNLLILTTLAHLYAKYLNRFLKGTSHSKTNEDLQKYQDLYGIYLQPQYSYKESPEFGELPYNRELEDDLETKINNLVEKRQQGLIKDGGKPVLPKELQTPKAHTLLNKAIKAGLLNKDYTPTDKVATKPQKALLANIIGGILKLSSPFAPFDKLWHVKGLAKVRWKSTREIGGVRDGEIIERVYKTEMNKT